MKAQKISFSKLFNFLNWFCFILIFFLFFTYFCHQITSFTQDLGRHIKLGEIIVQQKEIPKTNLFSFTHSDFLFINHHWLAGVVFFVFAQYLGLNSLIFLKIIVCSLAFFSLLILSGKHSGWPISLGWGLITLFLFNQRTEIRPEIFSYLFLSIYLIVLSRPRYFKKYFFILPLIQIPWVNTHIYFFLGPIMLLFYFINKRVLILTSLACLINPNFIKGALYPLFVFKNYGYRIVENQSFFFMNKYYSRIYQPYFLFVFLIVLISFLITLKKQSFYSFALFLFFSFLGFQAIRNIPIFSLGIFLLAAGNIFLIKGKIKLKVDFETVLNFKLLFYFIFIPFVLFLIYQNASFGFGKIKGAKNGVNFILNNKIAGPVFNNFDIGSYLIYRLYPQYQVFVDGRPEAYPASFFKETYIPMQEKEEKWKEVNKKYNFNFIFFTHTDITPWAIKFLKRISQDKEWQLVFLDDYVIVFLKKNNINKPIIEKFAINKNNFSFSCERQIDCAARIKRIQLILNP